MSANPGSIASLPTRVAPSSSKDAAARRSFQEFRELKQKQGWSTVFSFLLSLCSFMRTVLAGQREAMAARRAGKPLTPRCYPPATGYVAPNVRLFSIPENEHLFISLDGYIRHLYRTLDLPSSCWLGAMSLMARLPECAPDRVQDLLRPTAVHKTLLTCVSLASKVMDDRAYKSCVFATVGGVPTRDLLRMELELLGNVFHWDVSIARGDIRLVAEALAALECSHAHHHGCRLPGSADKVPPRAVACVPSTPVARLLTVLPPATAANTTPMRAYPVPSANGVDTSAATLTTAVAADVSHVAVARAVGDGVSPAKKTAGVPPVPVPAPHASGSSLLRRIGFGGKAAAAAKAAQRGGGDGAPMVHRAISQMERMRVADGTLGHA